MSSDAGYGGVQACVDGITGTSIGSNQICHTNSEYEAWWEVTLAAPSCVTGVHIYNAWDHCCRERIVPFHIKLYDSNGVLLEQKRYSSTQVEYQWQEVNLKEVAKVRVQLDGHTDYLHMGDVLVYGPSNSD